MDAKMKKIAIVVVVIVVLGVSALAVTNFLMPSTLLHYEKAYTGTKPVYISIAGLEDCILTLGYEDNDALMYRIDIQLYDSAETLYMEYREGTFEHFIEMNWENHAGTITRARSMNITLGTGHPYEITLGDSASSNVTGNIIFDNNAMLGNMTFAYIFPGSLNLVFTEDVDYSQGGLDMELGPGSNTEIASVAMSIDLPEGMDGHAEFRSDSMSISATGWILYDQWVSPVTKFYRTSENPTKPLLDISGVYADIILATLTS